MLKKVTSEALSLQSEIATKSLDHLDMCGTKHQMKYITAKDEL